MAITAINNFIIDKVYMGAMMSAMSNKTYWTLSQISNPQLSISTESDTVTDARGNTIMEIMKSKTIELSGDSALFDLSLLGAANGADVVTGVTENQYFDILDVEKGKGTVTLTKTPANPDEIQHIYILTNTNSLGKEYPLSSTTEATATAFAISGKTLKLPTEITEGQVFVTYAYNTTENATSITAKMEEFPKTGKFVLQLLGFDVCDKERQLEAYLIIPSAQLKCDSSITFQSQISQNFTIKALSDYCAKENIGFKLIIPNDGE